MLQTESKTEGHFVIIVQRGQEVKYIARNHLTMKKHIDCTIKINKAKRFNTWQHAQKFWEGFDGYDKELKFLEIREMSIKYELMEEK